MHSQNGRVLAEAFNGDLSFGKQNMKLADPFNRKPIPEGRILQFSRDIKSTTLRILKSSHFAQVPNSLFGGSPVRLRPCAHGITDLLSVFRSVVSESYWFPRVRATGAPLSIQ